MKTRLVATISDINLQRFKLAAANFWKTDFVEQRQRVVHRQPQFMQLATWQSTRSPSTSVHRTNRREQRQDLARQCSRHRRFDADVTKARQLQSGVTQIKTGNQAQ